MYEKNIFIYLPIGYVPNCSWYLAQDRTNTTNHCSDPPRIDSLYNVSIEMQIQVLSDWISLQIHRNSPTNFTTTTRKHVMASIPLDLNITLGGDVTGISCERTNHKVPMCHVTTTSAVFGKTISGIPNGRT